MIKATLVKVFGVVLLFGGLASAAPRSAQAARIVPLHGGGAAPSFSVIYNFTGGKDGKTPMAGLAADLSGNLFGTTEYGGTGYGNAYELVYNCCSFYTQTSLFSFQNPAQNTGAYPVSDLYIDSTHDLYGTTSQGGGNGFSGTVFKLTPQGSGYQFSVQLGFGTGGPWGDTPLAGLAADPYGNLFGTTSQGGGCGGGTVYQLTIGTIHDFGCRNNVYHAASRVTIDSTGAIYGTTEYGGLKSCQKGCGLAYKLTNGPTGYIKTNAHQFKGGTDGAYPIGPLALGRSGQLFGTTFSGGAGGFGTVYKLTPSNSQKTGYKEHVIYTFRGGQDGSQPAGGLVVVGGKIYGTTMSGGTYGGGTIFLLTPFKSIYTETILHNFHSTDGTSPVANLLLLNKSLFGTASAGGLYGYGTAWQMTL